jgi:hypothetical protein
VHGSIAIYGNDQLAAEFARGAEVADVAYVENVKTAVREGDANTLPAPIRDTVLKFVARDDLFMG